MKNYLKLKIFFIIIIFGCSCFNTAKAAKLFFDLDKKQIGVGDDFAVKIMLDSQGESLNAVEAKIDYSRELLKFTNFSDGNSIINFWVIRPKGNEEQINFAGMISNGYEGNNGLLANLNFEALKAGMANLSFVSETQIAKNNENGDLAKIETETLYIQITEKPESKMMDEKQDSSLPESFKPEIGKADDIYDGKYFLAFAAPDKDSGIDHYEVKEGDDDFKLAESPYLLKNQALNEEIKIKAVDKNGNERIEIVDLNKGRKTLNLGSYLFLAAVLLLFIGLAVWFFKINIKETR